MNSKRKIVQTLAGVVIVSGLLFLFAPRPAQALVFGGTIISSQYRTCHILIGTFPLPFPLQVIRVIPKGLSPTTLTYSYYQALLQIFGVNTSLYNYYQFYRTGPSILGTYIPAPIPWLDCFDLLPKTNLILKIGTSLF